MPALLIPKFLRAFLDVEACSSPAAGTGANRQRLAELPHADSNPERRLHQHVVPFGMYKMLPEWMIVKWSFEPGDLTSSHLPIGH